MDPKDKPPGEDTPAKVDQPIDPNQPPKVEDKKPDEVVIDHKAEAEKLRDQLKKAEHTIVTLKKDKKPKADEGGDDEGDDKGVRPDAVEQIVKSVTEQIRQDSASDVVNEELSKLTKDPDELAHIKLIYESKIVKTGFTREQIAKDLADSFAIANAPRIQKNSEEIVRAAITKEQTDTKGGSSGASIPSDTPADTNWNANEMALFQQVAAKMGVTVDKIIKK
jgi:hypothetical protein